MARPENSSIEIALRLILSNPKIKEGPLRLELASLYKSGYNAGHKAGKVYQARQGELPLWPKPE